MTLDLAAIRADVAADLADALGLPVHQTMPERPIPPLCYLHEGDPFVTPTEGGTYGQLTVTFLADIIEAANPNNAAIVAAADQHAAATVRAFARVEVGAYATGVINSQSYLTVPLTITETTTR